MTPKVGSEPAQARREITEPPRRHPLPSGECSTRFPSLGPSPVTTATGLTRTSECCHPTAGTLNVERLEGSTTDQRSWTFGPSCGAVTPNSLGTTPAACD
jgi:hypothetical protein